MNKKQALRFTNTKYKFTECEAFKNLQYHECQIDQMTDLIEAVLQVELSQTTEI